MAAASVALGLGFVGLGLIGVGANVAFAKPVTLSVDGVPTEVSVLYGTVAEVLAQANIRLEAHDTVEPALGSLVTADTSIIVRHARPVVLDVDGRTGVYWTTATSVAEVVNQLGLRSGVVDVSNDLETLIDRAGLTLAIDTGQDVTVTADGAAQGLHVRGTVADALLAAGLTWDDDDLVTPAPRAALTPNATITLVRVEQVTAAREIALPFETKTQEDSTLDRGRTEVDEPGQAGVKVETIAQTFHDGALVAEVVTDSTVTRQPVTRVERKGTKPLPATVDVSPGSAQEIALGQVLARGWDTDQFQCLVNLWNRESGWRVNAANPSGAYGIPQALPGSKMASAGADWQTNPATQITWGLGYISGRYGTPCGAWSFFQSRGWY
jgi:uncharacterized protein YabE (DUF348 family)